MKPSSRLRRRSKGVTHDWKSYEKFVQELISSYHSETDENVRHALGTRVDECQKLLRSLSQIALQNGLEPKLEVRVIKKI